MTANSDTSGTLNELHLARLLDITPRYSQRLAADGIVPRVKRGRYPIAPAVCAYVRFLRDSGGGGRVNPEDLEPFKRRAHYQAESEWLSLQLKAGELCPRPEAEAMYGRLFASTMRFVETLSDRLERNGVIGPKVAAAIDQAVDQYRVQLHAELTLAPPGLVEAHQLLRSRLQAAQRVMDRARKRLKKAVGPDAAGFIDRQFDKLRAIVAERAAESERALGMAELSDDEPPPGA